MYYMYSHSWHYFFNFFETVDLCKTNYKVVRVLFN